ncbi:emp24/gp25L/p24 family/GOLD-domain-containing protein, partial [Coprinopsis sp. MPI-PUGE-AT-0042]
STTILNQLIIAIANVGAAPPCTAYSGSGGAAAAAEKAASSQRVDIEIVDSSPKKNVYLHKRGIKGETRLAITTHADGEVGVCLKNYVEDTATTGDKPSRIVDLDVDIGADAIDYNANANQESLSGLETEMRKIEALVKELIDDMTYLKKLSTRRRVQNFAWFTIAALGGLGLWQILHLWSYFKKKYLID